MLSLASKLFVFGLTAFYVSTERLGITNTFEIQDFPANCEGDHMTLNGHYRLAKKRAITGHCLVSVQPGTTLELSAPLTFQNSLHLLGGTLEVTAVEPMGDGSCVTVGGNLKVEMKELRMRGCNSSGRGGALYIHRHLTIEGGKVKFSSCRAKVGGCVYVRKTAQIRGQAEFLSSYAESSGGGMQVGSGLHQQGTLLFKNCSSGGAGGGLFLQAGSLNISDSIVTFSNCNASQGGGLCAHDRLSLTATSSALSFANCHAYQGGGAYLGKGQFTARGGSILFDKCVAERFGGGLFYGMSSGDILLPVRLQETDVTFTRCHAGSAGGALSSASGTLLHRGGTMRFQNCSAPRGAALANALGADLADVRLADCTSRGNMLHSDSGNISADTLTITYSDASPSDPADVHVGLAAASFIVSKVDCVTVAECEFEAEAISIATARCPPGRSLLRLHSTSFTRLGCLPCGTQTFQPLPFDNPECLPCPEEAEVCNGTDLKLRAGYMLDVPDVSTVTSFAQLEAVNRTYFCPNAAACPGGRLAYHRQTDMCSPGYIGTGCRRKAPGYAYSDKTPYVVVKCPTTLLSWVSLASYLIGKDVMLFSLAASSMLGARAGRKDSSILLNQAMAFGTAAGSCLNVLQQSRIFADLQRTALRRIQDFLVACGIAIDLFTGQGDSDTSIDCFSSLAFPSSSDHLACFFLRITLLAVAPVALICILGCVKDFRLAILVGTNCFLPAVFSQLGRMLISFADFKGSKEIFAGTHGRPLLLYLPSVLGPIAAIFAGVTWYWIRAARTDEQPPPLHVVYLTGPYKQQHLTFEVERMLRKMLLTLISAIYPATIHPKSQLVFTGLTSLASSVAYSQLKPYRNEMFNKLESTLLVVSEVMILLSLLAVSSVSGRGWAAGMPCTAFVASCIVMLLATGTMAAIMATVCSLMVQERRKEQTV